MGFFILNPYVWWGQNNCIIYKYINTMFVLRQINKEGLESNMCLGGRYEITHKEHHPERFETAIGSTITHPDQEKVYAIISFDSGTNSYPLYKGMYYYIMTESGKTFANVSYR